MSGIHMKIQILSAAIFFCIHAFAMEKTEKHENYLTNKDVAIIAKASGYNIDLLVSEYSTRTRSHNKKCTLRGLLFPCRYLKPLRSKL
jgi:hypothetical protein